MLNNEHLTFNIHYLLIFCRFQLGPLQCEASSKEELPAVTFYLKSAGLKIDINDLIKDDLKYNDDDDQRDLVVAWDVYFEFKTTESTGTIFHSVIDKETIEIIVVNGTHILITYGSSIEVCKIAQAEFSKIRRRKKQFGEAFKINVY